MEVVGGIQSPLTEPLVMAIGHTGRASIPVSPGGDLLEGPGSHHLGEGGRSGAGRIWVGIPERFQCLENDHDDSQGGQK